MRISHDKLVLAKFSIVISVIVLLILVPEKVIPLLAVIVHYLYETMAFAIEELLTHGLDLNKFQAQMIVFYLSLAIGLLLVFWVNRRIPRILAWLKTSILRSYLQIRDYLLNSWRCFYARWKLQVLLAQAVAVSSLVLWSLVA